MALTEKNMAKNEVVDTKIADFEEKTVNTPETVEEPVFDGDIDLSATRKKKFRINGDNNCILELNTSDMNIITRLDNLYPKLVNLSKDASVKQVEQIDVVDDKALTKISNALTKIDVQMRQILDEIFDSNVSEVCAPSGSMFDPFNGEFRFEHIIDTLTKLYTDNINSEFKQMSQKIKKKTSKYTGKR